MLCVVYCGLCVECWLLRVVCVCCAVSLSVVFYGLITACWQLAVRCWSLFVVCCLLVDG